MRCSMRCAQLCALAVFLTTAFGAAQEAGKRQTRNIILVMTDGLRWQEVFRGAELDLLEKSSPEIDIVEGLKKTYWRVSAEERRRTLMPFFWNVIAKSGQVYGNRDLGSDAYVTNNLNFSYPGYSETLCGFADPSIHSNEKIPNPNVTVLEWLSRKPAYSNRTAAFAAWDVVPSILNSERAGFPVSAGYDPFTGLPGNRRVELLNTLKNEMPRVWDEAPFDALPFNTALEYLKARNPSILYLSLGETDDWAHDGNYPEYLSAAHRVDEFLRILWETVQSIRQYRRHTTLIFLPDHGRGTTVETWKDHGEKIPDSKYVWMAFLGPDTPALGERSGIAPVTENQIAATLAWLLGEDYRGQNHQAGRPITDVLALAR